MLINRDRNRKNIPHSNNELLSPNSSTLTTKMYKLESLFVPFHRFRFINCFNYGAYPCRLEICDLHTTNESSDPCQSKTQSLLFKSLSGALVPFTSGTYGGLMSQAKGVVVCGADSVCRRVSPFTLGSPIHLQCGSLRRSGR